MKVYVLDDDPAVLRMIGRFVEGAGHEFQGFASVAAFQQALPDLCYGCVMLDINMPEGNGLDVLEGLQHPAPGWPVVMVSGTTDVNDAITAFRRGAVQFLRKPFRRADFVRVLDAAATVAQDRLAKVERMRAAKQVTLTKRECEVLSAMDRGEQSKLIAWKLGLSCRTIDMHRTNILDKLSARNAAHAISIARDLGLVMVRA